ncbi:IS200/IS605 family transposase, partial [Enterobacter asburiae]|uniref:IS200/IS605 family transposase n=1 Tax=Enterobacter asburiae TaxID=61645 RepID=UPI00065261C3
EWVHVQLHQQKGMISLSPPTICNSAPPKYSVSTIVGYLKGKSAIAIARQFGRGKNFTGEVFWARGYFVSTVGLDEATVRAYIRKQEREDERYDQMNLNV